MEEKSHRALPLALQVGVVLRLALSAVECPLAGGGGGHRSLLCWSGVGEESLCCSCAHRKGAPLPPSSVNLGSRYACHLEWTSVCAGTAVDPLCRSQLALGTPTPLLKTSASPWPAGLHTFPYHWGCLADFDFLHFTNLLSPDFLNEWI